MCFLKYKKKTNSLIFFNENINEHEHFTLQGHFKHYLDIPCNTSLANEMPVVLVWRQVN